MLLYIFMFLSVGMIAGLLSGLLGIGGGIVVVPCLVYTLSHFEMSREDLMQIVLGTSLACIMFNTFISSFSHYRRKSIMLKSFRRMAPGIIIGAIIGSSAARYIPSEHLEVIFGCFECVIALYFFFATPAELVDSHHLPKKTAFLSTMGCGISSLSTLLGIGGGVLTVPALVFFKVPMRRAIGTSAATSFLISFVGTVCYLFYGIGQTELKNTLGFIYFPAFIAIAVGSLVAAPIAAKLSHVLPVTILRRSFAVLLFTVGILMIRN